MVVCELSKLPRIKYEGTLAALSCTNRGFREIFEPILYGISGKGEHTYAMRWGAWNGRQDVLNKARANGLSIHDPGGWTPGLVWCISDEIFPLDPSPMVLAVIGGHRDSVEWLLDHGAVRNAAH
jgi:hypothetical protein